MKQLKFVGLVACFMSLLLASISANSAEPEKVFELRTYTALPGQLGALQQRFSNHTVAIFESHGMTNLGYWIPVDAEKKKNTLIYIISHKSMEAAKANWAAFIQDPEWKKVRKASGRIVEKVDSVYMTATSFSKMK